MSDDTPADPAGRRLQATNNTISVGYEVTSDHDLANNVKSRLLATLVSQEIALAGLAGFSDVWQQLYDTPRGCEPFDQCGYRTNCDNCVTLQWEDVGIRYPTIKTNMSFTVAVQTGQATATASGILAQLRDSDEIRVATQAAGCVSCVVDALDVEDVEVVLPDCNGMLGGIGVYDACGVCDGNLTCLDCAGVANGDHIVDKCDNCTSRAGQCRRDCSGMWGGNLRYDMCGVCGGDDSKCNTERDCFGNWGGGHVIDSCDVCGGLNRSCADACGVPYGDTTTCQGCDGIPNSGQALDACNACSGDNSTCAGCDGVPYSGLVLDICGVCDGNEQCSIMGEALLFLLQLCETPPGYINGILSCTDDSGDDDDDADQSSSWVDADPETPVYIVSPISHEDPGQSSPRGAPRLETINSMRVFEQSFEMDLANALQVPSERVNLVSATQLGRTHYVIDYEIVPDRTSDRSPTQLAGQVEAMRLAGMIHDQSWLFSHIQRRVVAPPPPPTATGPSTSPTPGATPSPEPAEAQAMLVPADSVQGDLYGVSLAVSMFTAVVGSPGCGRSARVFRKSYSLAGSITWAEEANLVVSGGGSANDGFGAAVAVANSGTGIIALVGAKGDAFQPGSVYTFVRTAGAWSQQAQLVAPLGGLHGDGFGAGVSVSGGTAVVGAHATACSDYDCSAGTGGAYVFGEVQGSWSQIAKLEANGTMPGDGFGASVAISSSTVVVGAPNGTGGVVYVFGQVQGSWVEQHKLESSTPAREHNGFGSSVAISGDIVVVGAPGNVEQPGAAYAFMRTGDGWLQHARMTACVPSPGDGFGSSVSVSGFTAVIGSHARAAHMFVRSAGVWTGQEPLARNETHGFGQSVLVSGTTLLIGAPLDGASAGSVHLYDTSILNGSPRNCPLAVVEQPEPEPEPEPEPIVLPEPEPELLDAWVAAAWPHCSLECGPRAPVTRTVTCTINDEPTDEASCTEVKPATSLDCATQVAGLPCDDSDDQTMEDICETELAGSCAGKVSLVAAVTYDIAFDATDVAAAVDENFNVNESPIAVAVKGKLATTLSASGMSCVEEDITIISIAAGSLVIDYVVRVAAAVATPAIKAAAVAAVADPTTVGLPAQMMAIQIDNAAGESVFASGAVQEAFKSYAFVVSGTCPVTPCRVLCGAAALTADDVYTCAEDGAPANMTLCVASLGLVPTTATLCCGATYPCVVVTVRPPEPEPEPELAPEPEVSAPSDPPGADGAGLVITPEPRPDTDVGDHFDFVGSVLIPFLAVVGGLLLVALLFLLFRWKKSRSSDVKKIKLKPPKEVTFEGFLKKIGLLNRKFEFYSSELLIEGRELVQLTAMDSDVRSILKYDGFVLKDDGLSTEHGFCAKNDELRRNLRS